MLKRVSRRGCFWGKQFLKERTRAKDFYLGLMVLAFAGLLSFWLIPYYVTRPSSSPLPGKDPTVFPYCIAFALALIGAILAYNSPRTSKDITRAEDKGFSLSIISCIFLLFGYYLAVLVIGMLPASMVVLFALIKMFGFRRWFLSLLFAIVFAFILFLFFERIAQVPIPRGILFKGWY